MFYEQVAIFLFHSQKTIDSLEKTDERIPNPASDKQKLKASE